MNAERRHDATRAVLRRLEQHTTLSPFCRLFYRFLYDLIEEHGLAGGKLEQAFNVFLRCEQRRHETVGRIIGLGKLDLLQIIRFGHAAHGLLERLQKCLECMELVHCGDNMVRELLLAECCYHLGKTQEVVRHLRNAIRFGCNHALVHFALGYNLYISAMQRYTRADSRKGALIAKDPIAFEGACREAISAFERGLGNSAYDAQIYWWIGLIWEMLGNRLGARAAFKSAMEADPDNFGAQSLEKLKELERRSVPARSPAEQRRLMQLKPITDEDLRQAREFLSKCDSPFPEESRS